LPHTVTGAFAGAWADGAFAAVTAPEAPDEPEPAETPEVREPPEEPPADDAEEDPVGPQDAAAPPNRPTLLPQTFVGALTGVCAPDPPDDVEPAAALLEPPELLADVRCDADEECPPPSTVIWLPSPLTGALTGALAAAAGPG
jgi:hypothetical protein